MGRLDASVFTQTFVETFALGRRRWTTLLSFVVQTAAVAVLVVLPIFYTRALPAIVALGPVIGPPPGQAPPVASNGNRAAARSNSEIIDDTLRPPMRIPRGVPLIRDQAVPSPSPDNGLFVPGATGSREADARILSLLTAGPRPPAPPPSPARRIAVSSGVLQGLLIHQVRPVFPPLAIAAHVQGAVVLGAVITRAGAIENLRVVSGHPMLVRAAVEAVRQWRYRPYLLNGEPVEVETRITVNFTLGGG